MSNSHSHKHGNIPQYLDVQAVSIPQVSYEMIMLKINYVLQEDTLSRRSSDSNFSLKGEEGA